MSERPYTRRAQVALELANQNAARLGHEYIGTEHLLLGLLQEETGPAAQLLGHLGVTVEDIQALWLETTGRGL